VVAAGGLKCIEWGIGINLIPLSGSSTYG